MCLLDLDYNLPVQVRDQALGVEDEALPESDVGREFALERMANEGELGVAFNKSKANDTILKLQRTNPYYQVRHCCCKKTILMCPQKLLLLKLLWLLESVVPCANILRLQCSLQSRSTGKKPENWLLMMFALSMLSGIFR